MRRLLLRLACLLAISSLASTYAAAEDPVALPALGADAKHVSVSGLSSGGFMAVQYGVVFSSETIGVGVVAGGPYACKHIYGLAAFLQVCMQGSPTPQQSWDVTRAFSDAGVIDPASAIATQRIYLFSGSKDSVVAPSVMNSLYSFYGLAKVKKTNLVYVDKVPAGHAFIATNAGNKDCGANADPYVDRCSVAGQPYDQPKAILTQIYGPLKPKLQTLSSTPIAFDQQPFGATAAAMSPTGYLYVPAPCKAASAHCAVHVVFHGCKQSAKFVQDAVYGQVGYNRWADANRIIVLYPQVDDSIAANPLNANPQGCWDWWGYSVPTVTPSAYLFRSAPQLAAVHAMVARLLAQP
jgi:poly(3-hydroxybutyrate) depolymerase